MEQRRRTGQKERLFKFAGEADDDITGEAAHPLARDDVG
jgi:hypothetical protein